MKYLIKKQDQSGTSYAYINLIKDFRYLMTQLAYLTREYFVAVLSGVGDPDAVAGRLYAIPGRFQDKAQLIFGAPLSEEFLNLLSMHAAYVQALADALKTGNQEAADSSTQLLYKNAGDIAAAYAKANPFWDETQWKTLLYNYVNLLIQDAVALASHDYDKELDIFDRMLLAALLMGDYQAEGFLQYITATKG